MVLVLLVEVGPIAFYLGMRTDEICAPGPVAASERVTMGGLVMIRHVSGV